MDPALNLQPIGHIRSGNQVKFQTRHQPDESAPERTVLELLPGRCFDQALRDLSGFSRIWLIWWFHRNDTWRPLVQPPRGPVQKRGVFATRSPHRPNPLGITAVQLLGIRGLSLLLGPTDLVDGTPVFDIKPYVPAYDAFPGETSGWIAEVDALHNGPPRWEIAISSLAKTQAEWLAGCFGIELLPRIMEILRRDPSPHRTRRIKRHPSGQWMLGCGAWRALFTTGDQTVQITAIEPGYPARSLINPAHTSIPDQAAQLEFLRHWPEHA